MSERPVVVLDLDGVIIKSNFIKHRAMLAMFADFPGKYAAINAYILANRGVARRDKLVGILETILGVKATQERLARYLGRYARSLEEALSVAPLVDGVKEFVVRREHAFYVSSSAPEAEVRDQLVRNDLFHYFSRVHGNHTPKASALAKISDQHAGVDVVFFGDSLGDLGAAREAGVAFVGVTKERDNFQGLDVVKLADFDSLNAVDHAISAAIRKLSKHRPGV
jgi:phosphoglycolate phosphatase-like HAD superfamily hydrolase